MKNKIIKHLGTIFLALLVIVAILINVWPREQRLGGFTPGSSTPYRIALNDATARDKAHADVVVSSASDNVNTYIATALSAGYRNISISQGNGYIGANVTLATATRPVWIHGSGVDSTNLTMADNADDVMFIIGSGTGVTEYAGTISDMTLRGNKANQAYGVGIKVISGLQNHIYNLRIDDFNDYGVYIEGATSANRPDYLVQDGQVWISNSGIANLWVSKWFNAGTFVGLKSSDAPVAVSVNGSSADINFINPIVWNLTYRGFDIYEATKLTVLGLDADGSGREMVYISGSTIARSIAFIGGMITDANTDNVASTNFITYNNVNDFVIQGINFYETANKATAYIGGSGAGGTGTIIGNRANGTSGKAVVAAWDADAVRVRDNVGTGWTTSGASIITDGSAALTSLQLSQSLSAATLADHSWVGIAVTTTANVSTTIGQLVYPESTAGSMALAKADATTTMPGIALATGTIAQGASGVYLLDGFMRDDTWNWTPGAFLYADNATAGNLVATAPATSGDQVQIVAIAITADIIRFKPDFTLVEIS